MINISVIIATYNSSEFIEETLKSVYNQQGIDIKFKLDVILVDDCSTDSTLKIAKRFPVRIFETTENSGGPNKGRNIGLKNAFGDYICLLDHDDLWLSYKLVSQLPFLKKVKIVSCGYNLFDINSNKKFERFSKSDREFLYFPENSTFLKKLVKSRNAQNTYLSGLIFHSDLKEVIFEEKYGVVDFDYGLRLFENNDSIELCKPLFNRFVSLKNLSLNENYRKADYEYSIYFIEKYKNQYPKEYTVCKNKINGTFARFYYLIGNMRQARKYFYKSGFSIKNSLYIITSYFGHTYVRKHIHFFG